MKHRGYVSSCSLSIFISAFTLLSATVSGKTQPPFHSHGAGLLQAKNTEYKIVKGCREITQRHTARRQAAQVAKRSNTVYWQKVKHCTERTLCSGVITLGTIITYFLIIKTIRIPDRIFENTVKKKNPKISSLR